MYKDLNGKTALVTGSGKKTGIGYVIARKLAACKADVIIADLGNTGTADNDVKTGALAAMRGGLKQKKLLILSPIGKLTYWISRLTPVLYERIMTRQLKEELIRKML